MKKLILTAAAAFAFMASQAQTTTWNLDKSHSSVKFSVEHLVISSVEGSFKAFTGAVSSTSPTSFDGANINFSIDVNSVNTDDEKRDGHLKTADFFDAAKFSSITFKSKSMKLVSGNNYKLTGELTMHGVTKTVTFDVKFNGLAKDPWGNQKAGFKLTGVINRKDFGVGETTPGAMVSEEVTITTNIELSQAK
jgi:polyisoprenoid-binding protein YceI